MSEFNEKRKQLAELPVTYANAKIEENSYIVSEQNTLVDNIKIEKNFQKSLKISGNGMIAGIQIEFKGKIGGEINKPDSWACFFGKDKIIAFDLNATGIDIANEYEILSFSGELKLKKIIIVNYDVSKVRAEIDEDIQETYNGNDNLWNLDTRNYERIGETSGRNIVRKTNINTGIIDDQHGFFKDETGKQYKGLLKITNRGSVGSIDSDGKKIRKPLYYSNGESEIKDNPRRKNSRNRFKINENKRGNINAGQRYR